MLITLPVQQRTCDADIPFSYDVMWMPLEVLMQGNTSEEVHLCSLRRPRIGTRARNPPTTTVGSLQSQNLKLPLCTQLQVMLRNTMRTNADEVIRKVGDHQRRIADSVCLHM